jgi:hypothetical protein
MQWCNLFSNASKYNISVRSSRYKRVLYGLVPLIFCLILIIVFSYAYIVVLAILVTCLGTISFYLSLNNDNLFTHCLTITSEGHVSMHNETVTYQLLATSRLSFVGCWLKLQKSSSFNKPTTVTEQTNYKQFFIFKDSLSRQDFSRLVSVLKQVD